MELSFSFCVNLEPMKGAELTDRIPFLTHKTGAANGDFGAFPTVPVSAFQPWLRVTTSRQRAEFIFQACLFFSLCSLPIKTPISA